MINLKKIFTVVTQKQSMEFGQVTIFVSTFLALYLKENNFVIAAFILSFLTITVPYIFYPLAVCWFGFSKILGAFSSKILMSIVFIFIVIPVGVYRKLRGRDSLKLKQFKKNRDSVMVNRDHLYTKEDLLHIF
jgi:hypothetical protein